MQLKRVTITENSACSVVNVVNNVVTFIVILLFTQGTLPKKKKPQSAQKLYTKSKEVCSDSENEHIEQLKEKIVEINNKDIFIKELGENMEELKQKICDLNKQLIAEKEAYEEKLETINENYEVTLNALHSKHNSELETLRQKISNIEDELRKVKTDYEALKQNNSLQLAEFQKQIEDWKGNVNNLCSKFSKELKDKEGEIYEREREVETLQHKCNEIEERHTTMMAKIAVEHTAEIQEVEYEMLKTVTALQKELDREKRECVGKIEILTTEKQLEIEQLTLKYEEERSQAEAKIKQRIEDVEMFYQLKLEAQERESEQILKECQAIGEYNIIQCEVEKNHIKAELAEKTKECALLTTEKRTITGQFTKLQQQFAELQQDFDNATKELAETQSKLQEEIQRNEEKVLCDERTYEITIKQLHGTIEALKKRLLCSDRDVEQLKSELNSCEKSKLEAEDRCNKLQEELQQAQCLNEELEMANESSLKVTEERIQAIERDLQGKVEDYRSTAQKEVRELEVKLKGKEEELRDAMEQLHEQQKTTEACQDLIKRSKLGLERLEAINVESEYKNNRLENALKHLEIDLEKVRVSEREAKENLLLAEQTLRDQTDENDGLKRELTALQTIQEENETYKKQLEQLQKKNEEDVRLKDFYKSKLSECEAEIEESTDLRKKYIEQSGKYDELLHRHENLEIRNAELEAKVKEQESLIGPFREQLQAYEMEHKALLDEKHDAENEAREMGLKYASILGHQNQKQKIKYLVDLQMRKFELIEVEFVSVRDLCKVNVYLLQNKKELESKIRQQSRTIEKLKKELANVTKAKKVGPKCSDKENIGSPNRLLNVSHCESPGGPLKERN